MKATRYVTLLALGFSTLVSAACGLSNVQERAIAAPSWLMDSSTGNFKDREESSSRDFLAARATVDMSGDWLAVGLRFRDEVSAASDVHRALDRDDIDESSFQTSNGTALRVDQIVQLTRSAYVVIGSAVRAGSLQSPGYSRVSFEFKRNHLYFADGTSFESSRRFVETNTWEQVDLSRREMFARLDFVSSMSTLPRFSDAVAVLDDSRPKGWQLLQGRAAKTRAVEEMIDIGVSTLVRSNFDYFWEKMDLAISLAAVADARNIAETEDAISFLNLPSWTFLSVWARREAASTLLDFRTRTNHFTKRVSFWNAVEDSIVFAGVNDAIYDRRGHEALRSVLAPFLRGDVYYECRQGDSVYRQVYNSGTLKSGMYASFDDFENEFIDATETCRER